jgi:YidC/Oxa1 family membrane protein insertase
MALSVAVTFLCLPLYMVAERWQHKERRIVKKLKPGIDRIRAAFSGDERYMILSTFYRQNRYHPVYALRGVFGVLIQIPFFIAAYTYLSHLEMLRGARFLFISDLGAPDALIKLGGRYVNLLPVLMTLVNIIAGAIYTQGFPVKDKLQLYGISAVFLVLLYDSPAGLVLYWTMNNVLSLVKNIFYKLKQPKKVLYIMAVFCVFVFIPYIIFFDGHAFTIKAALVTAALLVLPAPLYVKGIKFMSRTFLASLESGRRQTMFALSCAAIAVLIGLCIPAAVIASSPEEFCFIDGYESPFYFICHTLLQSIGLALFWPLCVYYLFGEKIKAVLAAFFSILCVYALLNDTVFQSDYGTVTNTLHFATTGVLAVSTVTILLNAAALLCVAAGILALIKHKRASIVNYCLGITLAALAVYAGYNAARIYSGYGRYAALRNTTEAAVDTITPVFSLSKDKPNIVVVMADAAINGYVKPIFDEHPRLKEIFDGFTLYPNTVSFAMHTAMGAPPLWGGYDYTPDAINARGGEPLIKKYNESLLVLPGLLAGAGFNVTVADPSWANFEWIPDIRIYDGHENITAFNTEGRYTDLWYKRNNYGNGRLTSRAIERNMLRFSLLKTAPPELRAQIYDDGWYLSADNEGDSNAGFINAYAVLDFLPELTEYTAKAPSALLITNNTSHNLAFLQYPDYTPSETVTDRGDGIFSQSKYYHVNSAFYLKFGEWLVELKKHGVYDNTRIIIVSDHGAGVDAGLSETDITIPGERREKYNPLLLVKDFYAHGDLKNDMDFMTNADVPALALNGIVNEPVNPFTGNPIDTKPKRDGVYITTNHLPLPYQHGKFKFNITGGQWIYVHDNIFDTGNWEKAEK